MVSVRKSWKGKDIEVIFIKYSKPAKLEMIEIESDNKENIREVIDKLGGLVKEAGEELFLLFDKKEITKK